MNYTIIRIVSLFLVLIIIINAVAIKADSIGLGAAAVTLFGDDALAVIAAGLIGLGVLCKVESETSKLEFRYLCESAFDAMSAAGEWVVDGALTVYNCATNLWDYGVSVGMVQWLQDWIWSSNTVKTVWNPSVIDTECLTWASALSYAQGCRAAYWVGEGAARKIIITTNSKYVTYSAADSTLKINRTYQSFSYYDGGTNWIKVDGGTGVLTYDNASIIVTTPAVTTTYDIDLGVVASAGTQIETQLGDYIVIVAPNGVPDTGGDGNGDEEQPKIPIIPIPVLPSYDDTIQLPQEEIWHGNKVEVESPDLGETPDPTTGIDNPVRDPDGNVSNTPWETIKKWISEFFIPSGDITMYSLDLTELFPFCIPFDIFDLLSALRADPVAPVFELELDFGVTKAPITVDLSGWSDLASIIRILEVGLFCLGLALGTKELIGS